MFEGKKILVIGGTGTVGECLIKKLLKLEPSVIRVYSRDEYKQFLLCEEFGNRDNLRFLLGDVRDKERLNRAMSEIDIVFNLAALKHVMASEYNPFEAVKTNVIGTQNVIECAFENKVKRVIYTSSDKAVSPTNTMGATKLLAERIMSSAYFSKGTSDTIFASVRFGNVMGSRGSVIPLFKKQILDNRYVTLTQKDMTRFMMSVNQATELTIKACEIAKGGEVFVLKMPIIKLDDLAVEVIDLVCKRFKLDARTIQVKEIGLKPGEKMYEELMSNDEAKNAYESEDMYIIDSNLSEKKYIGYKKCEIEAYSSNGLLGISRESIREILLNDVDF